jgi:hypothetical protein
MRYEELTTPEAVLAAFEAGRHVEYMAPTRGGRAAMWLSARVGLAQDEVGDLVVDGYIFRALIEEPAIPAGFTPWAGGECPEDARGKRPALLFRDGMLNPRSAAPGHLIDWRHRGHRTDIIAYRVESEPKPEPAPSYVEAQALQCASQHMGRDADARLAEAWLFTRDDLLEFARRLRPGGSDD